MRRKGFIRPTPQPGDPVFWRASDGKVLGTYSQLKERSKTMRMIGTGKDPEARYPEGLIFDVPDFDGDRQRNYLKEQGFAKDYEGDDPGVTYRQVAESIVRGDPLLNPDEQKKAEKIGAKAYEMVHEDKAERIVGRGVGFADPDKAAEASVRLGEREELVAPGDDPSKGARRTRRQSGAEVGTPVEREES